MNIDLKILPFGATSSGLAHRYPRGDELSNNRKDNWPKEKSCNTVAQSTANNSHRNYQHWRTQF